MTIGTDSIQTLDDLRKFIHVTLCAKENLLEEQFGMQESQLVRSGRTCGIQFTLRGPRSVRLGAIWTADQNVLYLYDARGERYEKLSLPQHLRLDAA